MYSKLIEYKDTSWVVINYVSMLFRERPPRERYIRILYHQDYDRLLTLHNVEQYV